MIIRITNSLPTSALAHSLLKCVSDVYEPLQHTHTGILHKNLHLIYQK